MILFFKNSRNFEGTCGTLIADDILNMPIEYVFAYRIGGFWNIMLTWAANETVLSPEEMAVIVSQI